MQDSCTQCRGQYVLEEVQADGWQQWANLPKQPSGSNIYLELSCPEAAPTISASLTIEPKQSHERDEPLRVNRAGTNNAISATTYLKVFWASNQDSTWATSSAQHKNQLAVRRHAGSCQRMARQSPILESCASLLRSSTADLGAQELEHVIIFQRAACAIWATPPKAMHKSSAWFFLSSGCMRHLFMNQRTMAAGWSRVPGCSSPGKLKTDQRITQGWPFPRP